MARSNPGKEVDELLQRYPIITDQIEKRELRVILQTLALVLRSTEAGDVVEFGCYEGTTSLFLQRLLIADGRKRQLHLYDSFAGLPEKTTPDISPAGIHFVGGELHASQKQLRKNFQHAGLPLPTVHKVWFDELGEDDLPRQIAFAFLDGDFYESILQSLRRIENNLVPKAIVVVDDYQSEALPGVAKAVDEWLKQHPSDIRTEASLAIITPH